MTVEKINIAECDLTAKSIVTKVSVLVLAILFNSSIGIGIGNTFFAKVLLLVLTVVFTGIVNIPDLGPAHLSYSVQRCASQKSIPDWKLCDRQCKLHKG